jgi:dihydrofolate reductase
MGKVAVGLSMSLDGFVAGPNDGPEFPLGEGGDRLFDWYFKGEATRTVTSGNRDFQMTADGADTIEQAGQATGAIISGRRTFDIAGAWGGRHPVGAPVVLLTHHIPPEWDYPGTPFTFVTDGIEHAVAVAREIAGDKNVAVNAASLAQQCLKAGLLDEIHIDLVPVLLGRGVRLFEAVGVEPVDLEIVEVTPGAGVTHLTYRVIKP